MSKHPDTRRQEKLQRRLRREVKKSRRLNARLVLQVQVLKRLTEELKDA